MNTARPYPPAPPTIEPKRNSAATNRAKHLGIVLICAGMLFGGSALFPPSHTHAAIAKQPTQYLIILDVSGSMVWNLDGEGTIGNGNNVNCTWGGPSQLTYVSGCSGPNSSWHVESERRIYLAKQMVSKLIDMMPPNDTMEIVAFASGTGYAANTKVVPASGWTSDHDTLKAELMAVGSYNNNIYKTNGGSANAQALLKAQEELATRTATAIVSRYNTIVILVADGPANIFANGTTNDTRDICPMLTTSQASHTAACQIGYSDTYQMERPITAMISAADQLKQSYDIDLYTVTMVNTTQDIGMVDVASSPDKAYSFRSSDTLAQIAASYP